jgi:ABC-type Fe3+-hydroxamate transport system substrate-binding protein
MTSDAGLRDSLRLAAKAADREKAAEKLWPAFEKRLKELGYGPGAIARV